MIIPSYLQLLENLTYGVTRTMPGTLRDGLYIKSMPSPYTPYQISQWLCCIGFPTKCTEADISSSKFAATLDNLEVLMRLHLLAFPFENTSMH